MNTRFRRSFYQSPEGDAGGGGGSPPPAPSPAPAPAPTPAQSPAPAASPPAAAPASAAAAPSPAPSPSPAPEPGKGYWPEDWRTKAAGDDEKALKLLERYNSPADVAKALRELNVRISKGELKAPLKKDATPEETIAWRQEQGIPETPDKYDLTMPDGMVIGDNDKPLVDKFLAAMHGANATPDQVKAGVHAYLQIQQDVIRGRDEMDVEHRELIDEELRKEWGGEYKGNLGGIKAMLGHADKEVAESVLNARGPDGRALMNDPRVVRYFAAQARELGFIGGTVVPAGGDRMEGLDAEIKKIEGMQYTPTGGRNPEYWKDEKVQSRYRDLLNAKERLSK